MRPNPLQSLCLVLFFCLMASLNAAEKKVTSTGDMLEEAQRAHKAADAQMNAHYQRLLRFLEPNDQEALRVAQRAWLAFRDAEAKFSGLQFEGGTLQPVEIVATLAALTNARAKDLKTHLESRASTRAEPSPAKPPTPTPKKKP